VFRPSGLVSNVRKGENALVHCPYSDQTFGLSEPIFRRDFLDGTLFTSAVVAVGAACPFALGAQSPQTFPAGWTGYSGEGDYKGSAGNTEEVVGNAHSVRDSSLIKIQRTSSQQVKFTPFINPRPGFFFGLDGKSAARDTLRNGPLAELRFLIWI
jgi:hypothetical protein